MRILRTIFLLSAIGVLMPSPPETDAPQAAAHEAAEGGLCPQGSGLCETAAYLAERFQAKAAYSAVLVYEWALDAVQDPAAAGTLEARVEPAGPASPGLATASLGRAPGLGRSTLRLDDLIPEWRGPVPRQHEEG